MGLTDHEKLSSFLNNADVFHPHEDVVNKDNLCDIITKNRFCPHSPVPSPEPFTKEYIETDTKDFPSRKSTGFDFKTSRIYRNFPKVT